jgi:hypothetical protein
MLVLFNFNLSQNYIETPPVIPELYLFSILISVGNFSEKSECVSTYF